MSKWWFEDHLYDSKKNKTYSKGSGSRSWLTKLGGYYDNDYWKPKKNKEETYQDLLNQLQNSANIVGNSELGSIKVHWSDGTDKNEISENSQVRDIYLSPDNLLTNSEISEEVLDAMTGKVYLASTLRDTVDPGEYRRANSARRAKSSFCENAVKIWESLETSIARSKVLEDWSGFAPYIAGDSERSSASKKQVQDYINASEKKPNSKAASLAISWNILNSHDPVEVPEVYRPCMEAAASFMEKEIPAEKRYASCEELAKKIRSLLKDEESKSDGEGKPDGKTPSVCDSSLLGEVVKNETGEELAEQEADANEADKKRDDSKSANPFKVSPPDGMSNHGEKYDIIPLRDGYSSVEYNNIRRSHISEIRSIQNSLMFRNNSEKLNSYGHRTGEIDENNLFKVLMNDDRVMLRSDVKSKKNIAICLLVDESGSMCGRRVEEARNVAIIIGESLKTVEGIECSIYGHSGEEGRSTGVTIREYYTPRHKDMSRCMGMAGRSENLDSWAIMHVSNLFYHDYQECDRKIMFVISDGQPAGSCYGGTKAFEHMLSVSKACEKKGLEIYGIGIDGAYTNDTGRKMYGENRFVVLKDIKSSLGIITRFIRQIAMK